MRKYVIAGVAAVLAGVIAAGAVYGREILLMYRSIKAFDEKNLARSFQTMYEIQPSARIKKGQEVSEFAYGSAPIPDAFHYNGEQLSVEKFLQETKTSGLLVVAGDKIVYERYELGSDETTRFSSNSICKSFVSALVGIAIQEGCIQSVDDPVARYIPEFQNTEMEAVTIRHCLQMSSGIDFDEETDMGKISMGSLFGKSKMKAIAKFGLAHQPGVNRTYSSINTDILGEVIMNATGYTLSAYMEEKLWSKLGVEQDAYWNLSDGKEVANGGLHISLRDYARFGRLYMNNGVFKGERLISERWIQDSMAAEAPHLKAPHNGESDSELGYGYQWWLPEGDEQEFTAIGVFGQWLYVNPAKEVVIVKTSADSGFEEDDKEKKTIALFREIAKAAAKY